MDWGLERMHYIYKFGNSAQLYILNRKKIA